jgi:hypothetical protein
VHGVRPIRDLHVDVCPRRVPTSICQRLLDDAIRGEIDARRQGNDLSLQDQPDVGTGVARRVDQVVQPVEARLRRALGLARDVLAQHSEQAPGLGQRLAGRHRDRLEAAARVGGQLGRGEPCGLALDGDHRQVVGHDVVQLARDAGPLFHRRLLAHALGHRELRRVELRDDLGALARRLADEHRGCHEQKRAAARQADAIGVQRSHRVDDEGHEQRSGDEEAAADDEVPHRVEQHAEARQRERRVVLAEDQERDEGRRCRSQERKAPRRRQRQHREHVQEDPGRAVARPFEGELTALVGCVDARLDRRSHSQQQCQRQAAVAAGEHLSGAGDEAFALPRKLHDAIVVGRARPRLTRPRDLRAHPTG